VNWTTTRFGNTELRKLARDMLQETTKSKFTVCQQGFQHV
jgi:hypothetical protein